MVMMKYGFILPFGDARIAAQLARAAENAGWNGFFVWEGVWSADAWVSLTAAAMTTEKIRIGTMLSPLSRMRPWRVASQSATLDHLSGGRLILSVGLGALDTGFAAFGEETHRKVRAELLDESLEIITSLWKGEPINFEGSHYTIKEFFFPHRPPRPVQQPRIPIWVVGVWPKVKSMSRALRYDGLLPAVLDSDGQLRMSGPNPQEIAEITRHVQANRGRAGMYDIVIEGATPGDDPIQASSIIEPWQEAGATWWLEAMWTATDLAEVDVRINQGPPRRSL